MTFLTAFWAWGLAALLPGIVVLYMLKLKRQRVQVPSTLLWRRAVQDMVANAPFQKLRNNLLMWLQLLALALLILAFMRPVLEMAMGRGERVVFVIDHSASMQSVEADGETRLESAKREALRVVEGMSASDEGIVVAVGQRTNVVQTLTSDRAALRAAIQGIQPTDERGSFDEAGAILLGLTTQSIDNTDIVVRLARDSTRTLVFSDGAVEHADALAEVPNIEFVRVGETRDNVGISALDVREAFSNNLFERQVFASITNASEEERRVFAELRLGNEVIDFRAVEVPGGSTQGVVFRTGDDAGGVAIVAIDGDDALALDNEARVVLAPQSQIDVLIVSRGNPFLEQVFLIDPRVSVSVIRPTDYRPDDEFDLVVFEDAVVAELPAGNFLFVNSVPPVDGFREAGPRVRNPRVVDWNRLHPLSRFADFEQLRIADALDLEVPSLAVPIVESIEGPLVAFYEGDSRRIVTVAFDILRSDWPLQASFPIFISNLVDMQGRGGVGVYRPAYATGESIAITPARDASSAVVTTPSGERIRFSFEGVSTAYLTQTSEAGIYRVEFDTGRAFDLAVNLLSENESNIAPREELQVGAQSIIASTDGARRNREAWHWFVLAALGVLLVEWAVYCKRTFM